MRSESRPTNGPSVVRETENAANTSPISIPVAAKVFAYRGKIGAIIVRPTWAVAVAKKRLAKQRFSAIRHSFRRQSDESGPTPLRVCERLAHVSARRLLRFDRMQTLS